MLKICLLFHLVVVLKAFPDTNFDLVRKEYNSILNKPYVLLPHKGSYLLPISYNSNPNEDVYNVLYNENTRGRGDYYLHSEAEFQISFMTLTGRRLFGTEFNLFLGYTHEAWWQLYNEEWSRPFRESNYSPEIFARRMLENTWEVLGGKVVAYDVGFVHQSNGQTQELSRSWNRWFFRFAALYGEIFMRATVWSRVPEESDRDDNPDITKYMGYGELKFDRLFSKARFGTRIVPGTEKQGIELSYSYPWQEGLRYYIKLGYGYGLNLIDYNHKTERIGFGISLTDIVSASSKELLGN
ncbi:MAG: phospholipase [Halobacteriovoraceae bacterium]|nr:phospholipase [Halobacteriovoraceae bacterium]